ncbi:DUF397 domain-containing protein [Actinophytocola sp.]|uniref:DUF397 domain-containing protein n=1 Tax=Actinophytocola sp. TaxID=1872138 RepID=UPI00389A07F5
MNPGPAFRWRKSSFSSSGAECVEVAFVVPVGAVAVRDSKNPGAPAIRADLDALLRATRAGRFDR